ncbi:MAG: helix-turn-helix domain-containing protein [candidate division NC10 bacterium]|nr:helix-turn-helix domain-containing protein [candidate division NC10 bacterium]
MAGVFTAVNENERLTPRQRAVITYLVAAPTIEEAARRAKISKTTIYKWLREEAFREVLKAERNRVLQESLDVLKWAAGLAVLQLVALASAGQQESTRLGASKAILDYTLRAKELEELEARIETLERAIQGKEIA